MKRYYYLIFEFTSKHPLLARNLQATGVKSLLASALKRRRAQPPLPFEVYKHPSEGRFASPQAINVGHNWGADLLPKHKDAALRCQLNCREQNLPGNFPGSKSPRYQFRDGMDGKRVNGIQLTRKAGK